jgi:hypothetical protein
LLSIGTIILLEEIISLLSVGVSKIKNIEEFDPKQGTSYQTSIEVVLSTMKSKDFFVKPKVSLRDKVYLETYYHHSQHDIQMKETPAKIQVQNLQIIGWTLIEKQ